VREKGKNVKEREEQGGRGRILKRGEREESTNRRPVFFSFYHTRERKKTETNISIASMSLARLRKKEKEKGKGVGEKEGEGGRNKGGSPCLILPGEEGREGGKSKYATNPSYSSAKSRGTDPERGKV